MSLPTDYDVLEDLFEFVITFDADDYPHNDMFDNSPVPTNDRTYTYFY